MGEQDEDYTGNSKRVCAVQLILVGY